MTATIGNDPEHEHRPEEASRDDWLRGLTVALHTNLASLRRISDELPADELRDHLGLIAAMVDVTREAIGEDAIAAQLPKAREVVEPRRIIEVGSQDGYALWSHSYDDELNPVILLEEQSLRPLIGDVAGKRVLDVGCGTGRWSLHLARQGAQVTGVDPCPEMLAKARRSAEDQGLDIEWLAGGFGDLPEAGDYDMALCSLVLCHLPEIDGPVGEMATRLRPGGRLIISDFHFLCQVIGWRTAFDYAGRHYHIENYIHDYGEFVGAFRKAGLIVAAIDDVIIDQSLAARGEVDDTLYHASSRWNGYPICMVIAGEKSPVR